MGVLNIASALTPVAYAAKDKGADAISDLDQAMSDMQGATDALQGHLVDQSLLLFGSMLTSAAVLAVYIAVPLIVWHRAKQDSACSWCSAARKGAFAGLVAAFALDIIGAIALLAMTATGFDGGYGQMSVIEVVTVVVQMAAIAVCAYVVRISDARGQGVGLPIAIVTLVLGNLVAGILLIVAWQRGRKVEAEPAMFRDDEGE